MLEKNGHLTDDVSNVFSETGQCIRSEYRVALLFVCSGGLSAMFIRSLIHNGLLQTDPCSSR